VLGAANSLKEVLYVFFLVLLPTVPITLGLAFFLRRSRRTRHAEIAQGQSGATPFRLISIVGAVATVAVLLVVLLVVGVRALADPDDGGETVTVGGTPAEEQPQVPQQGNAAVGQMVFERSGCGDCHSLMAAKATGTVGPNLDESNPDFTAVVECVTKGPGDMPSFSGRLSGSEIRDVAKYVATVTPQ
jgi:mono/diheme cytochrome c family protein